MPWNFKANLRGVQGYTVDSAAIESNGHLTIGLTSGEEFDAGNARGPQGLPGFEETPTDPGIAALVSTSGSSETKTAIQAVIGDRISYTGPSQVTAGMNALALNADNPITTPTYDGSGQAVHPSVEYIAGGFGGYEYWMGMTPYPATAEALENPSILASNDGINWVVPPGLTNPLYPKPTTSPSDFNSDIVLAFAEGYLYAFFRSYQSGNVGTQERIYYRRSRDGVNWEAAVLSRSGSRTLLAPAVLYNPARKLWYMWAVDTAPSPNRIVRFQATAPNGPWSNEVASTGITTDAGYEIWHIDIHRSGGEYVLLTHSSAGGEGVVGGHLRRSVSLDGATWTTDKFDMMVQQPGQWDELFYKSCIRSAKINGRDGYRVWYGGYRNTVWRIGHTVATLEPDLKNPIREYALGVDLAVADTFSRVPGATSPGTLNTGQGWTTFEGTPTMQGSMFTVAAGFCTITVPTAVTDVDAGVTLMFSQSGVSEWWLQVRRTSASNMVRFGRANNGWTLQAWNGSSVVQLGFNQILPPTAKDRVRITVKGLDVRCYVNDRMVIHSTLPVALTGTLAGLQLAANGAMDDFWAVQA